MDDDERYCLAHDPHEVWWAVPLSKIKEFEAFRNDQIDIDADGPVSKPPEGVINLGSHPAGLTFSHPARFHDLADQFGY